MITLGTRLKNLAFLVIGLLSLSYIAVHYADLGRYAGLSGTYTVHVELAQAAGLLTNADVTYRGVSVGRVGPLHLTDDGVRADLRLENTAPRIPASVQAVVAGRSAVGEQYIDLRPTTGAGPYLEAGSVIPRTATVLPAPVTDLLAGLDDFASSVPLDALRTVVEELGLAFTGQGPDLQALLDHGDDFVAAANEHSAQTTSLIENGENMLRTQNQEAASLKDFASGAKLLAEQLKKSDPDLRRLIATAPGAAAEAGGLLRDLDPELGLLLSHLLNTSDVLYTRQAALRELFVRAPAAIAVGSSVVQDGRLNLGMVTTFFDPLPCTRGYGGTVYRNGLDFTDIELNAAARCTLPVSGGVNVRGSAQAPKGGRVPPASAAGARPPGALSLPPLGDRPSDLPALLGIGGR
ncbi:MCE family protein [Actinocorallia populi]|uniref:MCE family protein n=1 Tax=Actinocorallia populi TaxID=2079200 RepID=UPI000D08E159|nr:MlaD family protein [Actinocorallia populi]